MYWQEFPLLTSGCQIQDVQLHPFPHLVISEALPKSVYEQLREEFPSFPSDIKENERFNLAATSKLVFETSLSPLWKSFVTSHSSTDFITAVQQLFSKSGASPWLSRFGRFLLPRDNRWGLNPDDLQSDVRRIRWDGFHGFQIASHAGASRPVVPIRPHHDSKDKLFSCLFYMRSPKDTSTGGELEIHQLLNTSAAKRIGPEDSRVISTIPYSANTAVIFPDSPHAIHAVRERSATSEPRQFCFIFAHIPRYDHGDSLLRNVVRVNGNRLQRRLFRRG